MTNPFIESPEVGVQLRELSSCGNRSGRTTESNSSLRPQHGLFSSNTRHSLAKSPCSRSNCMFCPTVVGQGLEAIGVFAEICSHRLWGEGERTEGM